VKGKTQFAPLLAPPIVWQLVGVSVVGGSVGGSGVVGGSVTISSQVPPQFVVEVGGAGVGGVGGLGGSVLGSFSGQAELQ